jgi:hypothetical protein
MADINPEADLEYAEEMDDELVSEQEEDLANPAPFEAEIAENPEAAYEALEYNENVIEPTSESNFVDDYNAEIGTDEAITGGEYSTITEPLE